MAILSVGVEGHLGIESMHFACGLEDQRVDLSEVAVAFGETAIQLDQDVCGAIEGPRGDFGIDCSLASSRKVQAIYGVDVQFDDRIRISFGYGFNLHTALSGQHQEMLLGGTIQGEACVVLLIDVGGLFDPDPLHEMTLNVHPQNVGGVGTSLIDVVGELDAAGFAATAHLYLSFNHDRVSDALGDRHRIIHC